MVVRYRGFNGMITIDGPTMTLSRTGMTARLSGHLMGDRTLPLAALTGLTVQEPTIFLNGHLQMAFGGESLVDLRRLGAAPGDPNTIVFTLMKRAALAALAGFLAHVIEVNKANGVDSASAYAAAADPLLLARRAADAKRNPVAAQREAGRAARQQRQEQQATYLERRRIHEAEQAALQPARAREIANYDQMNPSEFERALAYLCQRDGCTAARVVGGAGDLGADVIATTPDGRRMVIQAKRYAKPNTIGSQVVQTLNGTYRDVHRAHLAVIVTTSTFTGPAQSFAAQVGIRLIDRNKLAAWASQTGSAPWN